VAEIHLQGKIASGVKPPVISYAAGRRPLAFRCASQFEPLARLGQPAVGQIVRGEPPQRPDLIVAEEVRRQAQIALARAATQIVPHRQKFFACEYETVGLHRCAKADHRPHHRRPHPTDSPPFHCSSSLLRIPTLPWFLNLARFLGRRARCRSQTVQPDSGNRLNNASQYAAGCVPRTWPPCPSHSTLCIAPYSTAARARNASFFCLRIRARV